jgi:hypothetical protein
MHGNARQSMAKYGRVRQSRAEQAKFGKVWQSLANHGNGSTIDDGNGPAIEIT